MPPGSRPLQPRTFTVTGRIRRPDGAPLAGVVVQAFDRTLRRETFLGAATTDADGRYSITYESTHRLRPDRPGAHAFVRVLAESGVVLATSGVAFNAAPAQTLDVVTGDGAGSEPEYVVLRQRLQAAGVDGDRGDLSDADLTFLRGATGIDARTLARVRASGRLASESGLGAEVAYGLTSQGLPTSLEGLLGAEPDRVRRALRAAVDGGVIRPAAGADIEGVLDRLEETGVARGLLVRHQATLVLRDVAGGAPLVGFEVRVFDAAARAEPRAIARGLSDGKGRVAIGYPGRAEAVARRLRIEITDPAGVALRPVEIAIGRAGADIPVDVERPRPPEKPSRTLDDALRGQPAIPAAALAVLARQGIRTLADVRTRRGLARIEGLADHAGERWVRIVETYAALETLTDDPRLSDALVARGYVDALSVAHTSRRRFVEGLRDAGVSAEGAARLHEHARIQVAVAEHATAPRRTYAKEAGDAAKDKGKPDSEEEATGSCDCPDCATAVSPRAYLVDLLGYTLRHVRQNDGPVTLAGLTTILQVSFADLVDSCEAATEPVRQIRLCIEVLRRAVGTPADGAVRTYLAAFERNYRAAAYRALLVATGTSRDELRRARGLASAQRTALAERLGFHPTDGTVDRLDALLIPGDPTEAQLADLWGLPATTGAVGGPAPVAKIEQWRLAHLRSRWASEDHPGAAGAISPIIDPDLVGIDDLRSTAAGATTPFGRWQARRQQVDADLLAVRALAPDPVRMLQHVFTGTPPDVAALSVQLEGALDRAAVDAAELAIVGALGLEVEAFRRLAALHAAATAGAASLTATEWDELSSLLAQSLKARQHHPAWRTEEQSDGLMLGPQDFWPAPVEPTVGPWPPAGLPARSLVDPDLVATDELRDVTVAGLPAAELWRQRAAALESLARELRALRDAANVAGMVKAAAGLGDSETAIAAELQTLHAALTANPDPASPSGQTLRTRYRLSPPQLDQIVRIKSAAEATSSLTPRPTAADWDALVTLLRGVYKDAQGWKAAEGTATYWEVLRHALPPWRSSVPRRDAWRAALAAESRPPIVDPDLVSDFDLATVTSGNAAAPLFQARRAALNTLEAAIDADRLMPGTPVQWLERQLGLLGLAATELTALSRSPSGRRVQARLAQIGLSLQAFTRLMEIRHVLASVTPDSSELAECVDILVAAHKRRLFARWRAEERAAGVTLSPDFFGPRAEGAGPAPRAWRVGPGERAAWQRQLAGRVEQEAAIRAAVRSAVSAAEEAALPPLRDGLVWTAYIIPYLAAHPGVISGAAAPGADPAAHARWVSRRYQIDAEVGPCRETTRIGQAIETVQSLVWSVHGGLVTDVLPALTLDADDFDADWLWMGSYASWRGAMFAFLYPENILLPSLRRHQSPVFAGIVAALRAAGRATAADAAAAARAYADYFRDVGDIRVEATASVTQPRGSAHLSLECVLFGRGPVTGRAYYALKRVDAPCGFWTPIPGLDDARLESIAGAKVYDERSGDSRAVFVFFRASAGGSAQLLCHVLRVPMEAGQAPGWLADGATALDVGRTDEWDVLVGHTDGWDQLPYLMLWGPDGAEIRVVNETGSAWAAADDARPGVMQDADGHPFDPGALTPRAFVYTQSRGLWLLATSPVHEMNLLQLVGIEFAFTVSAAGDVAPYWGFEREIFLDALGQWKGAQYWPRQTRLVAFFSLGADVSARSVDISAADPGQGTARRLAGLDGTEAWAFGASPFQALTPGLHQAYERPWASAGAAGATRAERRLVELRLQPSGQVSAQVLMFPAWIAGHYRLAPVTRPSHPTTTDLTGSDADLGQQIRTLVDDDAQGSRTTRTYLDEAFHSLPVYLALELHRSGYFDDALAWFRKVYDYTRPAFARFVYPPLDPAGATQDTTYVRDPDWLADPLDVHAIAALRPGAAPRFVLLALVRCVLDYADAEFARDTGESVARARLLYLQALALLDDHLLAPRIDDCEDLIATLTFGPEASVADLDQIRDWLSGLRDVRLLRQVVAAVQGALAASGSWRERMVRAQDLIEAALGHEPRPRTIADALQAERERAARRHWDAIAEPAIAGRSAALVGAGGNGYAGTVPALAQTFCVPANPVLRALRLRAELNLFKIRTCRNIAGQERALEAFAAPTDAVTGLPAIGATGQIALPGARTLAATPYRYRTLVERARQLAGVAQQMEASFLGVLERRDGALLDLLRARQQASVARGHVRLQDLRVLEAEHGVDLAERQRERAAIQADHFAGLLEGDGLLDEERWARDLLWAVMWVQFTAAAIQTAGAVAAGIAAAPETGGASLAVAVTAAAATPAAAAVSSIAGGLSSWSAALSMIASFERRAQEWRLQLDLARQDELIGDAQVALAGDRVRITGQERVIATLEADHADDVVEFLRTRFTNAELYDWMSGVLEGAYRYFLQQATAVARLAEAQLAFERQELPPAIVQGDYWDAPRDTLIGADATVAAPDRRGLTGSVRLLQDITRLDQHAFDTDRRKLQLARTVSLARLDPFAFQRFRETGVMIFATPMALFDRDFPGHYIRLIKRVRTSVIALIPPTEGIKATLSTSGISRVVIGGDVFQTTVVHRPPESVALTSPQNATGLFELEAQGQGEMLLPFEALGVDTTWELRMPRAANPIDYRTLADVLVTVEYTALDSFVYRQQVLRDMDRSVRADRPFSFRQQFADQWYDLNHAELVRAPQPPMTVRFATSRRDFPANLTDLAIEHVMLYFVRREGQAFEVPVERFTFTEAGSSGAAGGAALSVNGLVSTRQSNAASWTGMIGKGAAGTWELALPDTEEIRARFTTGEIEDILFVISYSGLLPSWPA